MPRRVQAKDALVPGKKQDIVAPFAGRVIEIRYKTGDTVRAGAVVAIMQSNALVQRGDDLEASVGAAAMKSKPKSNSFDPRNLLPRKSALYTSKI